MSKYTDDLTAQMLAAAAAAVASRPPNPVEATVDSAAIDDAGVRTITVAYAGAAGIPTKWTSAFDVVIQVVTQNQQGNMQLLVGKEVLVVTNTTPPTISDMTVRT